MVENLGNINNYQNEYQKIKKEHPKADIQYDEKTNTLFWSESTGVLNKKSASGKVVLESNFEKSTSSEELNKIFEQLDNNSLSNYIEQGFLTKKKNLIEGEYYVLDLNKYKEATGQENVTLGEIKKRFGLKDGVLSASNSISFKENGTDKDYDSASLNEMRKIKTLKIPAAAVFAKNND